MKKYRHFRGEFKRSLVVQIDSGAISKAAAAREQEVSSSLVDRWQQQIYGHHASPANGPRAAVGEGTGPVQEEGGELTIQNVLLKKLNETCAYMKRSNGYVVTGAATGRSKRGAK